MTWRDEDSDSEDWRGDRHQPTPEELEIEANLLELRAAALRSTARLRKAVEAIQATTVAFAALGRELRGMHRRAAVEELLKEV